MDEHNWLAPKEPVWILKNGSFIRAIVESANNDIVICLLEDGSYIEIPSAKQQDLYIRRKLNHFGEPLYPDSRPLP